MTGTELMRAILERESLSPVRMSVELGHSKGYLNTLMSLNRDCQLQTIREFCELTGYEIVVRSRNDGYEFTL